MDADCAMGLACGKQFGFVHEVLAEHRNHEGTYSAKVASKNGEFLFGHILLLDRYGPRVLSVDEYTRCRQLYRRHYLRRLLVARFKYNDKQYFSLQMKRLAQVGDPVRAKDFAVAVLEWFYFALTGQRNSVWAPGPPALQRSREELKTYSGDSEASGWSASG